MSRRSQTDALQPGFSMRRNAPAPALRGLDALATRFTHRRAKKLSPIALPTPTELSDHEEPCRRGLVAEEPSSLIAAALEAIGDGLDQTVADAAAALIAGDFVEGLSSAETERATLIAAIAFGWRTSPCHVIAPDAEAAEAWAATAAPLCARAGLTLTLIHVGATPAERRKAYSADIVAVASRTLMSDFARDQMALGALTDPTRRAVAQLTLAGRSRAANTVTRGLGSVLLLDAAHILFEDATAPVRLTQSVEHPMLLEQCRAGIEVAKTLVEPEHFRVRRELGLITWSEAGERAIRESPAHHDFVGNAVRAMHLLERGRHYLVDDEKIILRDDASGHTLEGRTYRQGLQQTIEIIEGLAPSPLHESVVQISVPHFYRQPIHLAGCAQTLQGHRPELHQFYRKSSRLARSAPQIPRIEFALDTDTLIDRVVHTASAGSEKIAIVAHSKAVADTISRALRAEHPVSCPDGDALPSPAPRRILYAKLPASRLAAHALGRGQHEVEFCTSLEDPVIKRSLPNAWIKLARKSGALRPHLAKLLVWKAWRHQLRQSRHQRLTTFRTESWGKSILDR